MHWQKKSLDLYLNDGEDSSKKLILCNQQHYK